MGLFVTVIIGAIIGFLASMWMRINTQRGLVANIVVGIIGSFAGQFLVRVSGFSIPPQAGWIVGIGGAALLIAVLRYFGFFRSLAPASR
jgi:uncharacterized membrane protein YeaQ/YmgE (transglycosylase-associated protein family)